MEPICIREDVTISPNDRQLVLMTSQLYEDTTVTGILQPSNTLNDDDENFAKFRPVCINILAKNCAINKTFNALYSQAKS